MNRATTLTLGLAVLVFAPRFGSMNAKADFADDKLNAEQLKTMIEGLGYETNVLNKEEGKEKYEFKITTTDLNVPVAAELSASKNYIWLTVFLGVNDPKLKYEEMLKRNAEIQPSFFYITSKNNVMMAQAIDNRNVNPAVLKRCIEKISGDVQSSQAQWKVSAQ